MRSSSSTLGLAGYSHPRPDSRLFFSICSGNGGGRARLVVMVPGLLLLSAQCFLFLCFMHMDHTRFCSSASSD